MIDKGIVFGKGFLGLRIAEEFGYKAVGREHDPLNISSLEKFLDNEKPDVVINAIGKTSGPGSIGIDWCEHNKEETIKSNIVAAINLSSTCAKKSIYFVHLGSGCIYEGDNNGNGFGELDEPNFYGPQFYAKTKIIAEKVLKELPGLILRIRMPIDNTQNPRNLITKLANYEKVIDVQNSATCVPDMLPAIRKMMQKNMQGVYNFVNPGTISAFEIMEMYQRIVDSKHEFSLMDLDQLNSKTDGKRSNCYLNTEKLNSAEIILPEIHASVEFCLKQYGEVK